MREHEVNKYLQLFPQARLGKKSRAPSSPLPDLAIFRDTLASQVENLTFRLAIQGAFVVLFDGQTLYFLAGTHISDTANDGIESLCDRVDWLGCSDSDVQHWQTIVQDITETAQSCSEELILTITSMRYDNRSKNISSVCGSPHLSFLAGAPLLTRTGVAIGALFVVDQARDSFNTKEKDLLITTAARCTDQLKAAREIEHQDRWQRVSEQLSEFVRSRAARNQELEEPPSLARTEQQQRRQNEVDEVKNLALRNNKDPAPAQEVEIPEATYQHGPENERLMDEEMERDERLKEDDNKQDAKTQAALAGNDMKRSKGSGESTYRKVFRRAAQCLIDALDVDGVLFSNGLVGHHGAIHAAPELEDELERDIRQRPGAASYPEENVGTDKSRPRNGHLPENTPQEVKDASDDGVNTRRFDSAEYVRGVKVERPAQIIGMASRDDHLIPESSRINKYTVGLTRIDECHLQLLMDKYPMGVVWYVDKETGVGYKVMGDTLTEEAMEDTQRLLSSFPGVRQVLFQPLTDPVSLKRLAGCFAWTTRVFPLLSDTTDIPSLRGFLHVLESEISRIDASAAVKQKEAFVSSVSHELRTPLHGILGSTQLLTDTRLNSFQAGLVDTIRTSGSTLNETLTSVLSYAKINQFERQQHKLRGRAAAGSKPPSWSLENKEHSHGGLETEYQDLYLCTNVAMLFEEIAGVLEGGRSYDKTMSPRGVTVTLEMDYRDNWNFLTEPGALRRIAVNIIGNALKYTTRGSVVIRLTSSELNPDTGNIPLAAKNKGRRLVKFSVKDTGKGMSKDFMDNHLFVPFTQEDTTSSNGVGLGMSIVKGLISQLAGSIEVSSEQGKGTEITVTIPMRLCTQDDEDKPAAEMARCIKRVQDNNLTAILFGFPTEVRKSLERYLREWFHCEVLQHDIIAQPDLVLMDEGNEEIAEEVAKTAHQYGQTGILLSIAMETDRLANPMKPVDGYKYCERIPPPIGPNNLGKSLSACIDRLQDLRKCRKEGRDGEISPQLEVHQPFRGPSGHPPKKDPKDKGQSKGERGQTYSAQSNGSTSGFCDPSGKDKENESRGRHESPQSHQSDVNTRPHSAGSDASTLSVDPSSLRVLVAEDNAINRKIMGAFLKKSGIENVQYAENGSLAVEAVEKELPGQFDIIFMDLSMPFMNGFTATREIRRIERESDVQKTTYVVALTGLASDRDEDAACRAGVDMFVTKPVQFDKLTDVLKQQEKILGRS